jgi:hypothetical protein
MEKLKLNLDEIKVESFATNFSKQKFGTILGNVTATEFVTCGYTHCDEYTCGDPTCAGGTCDGGNTCYCTIDDPGCPTVGDATCVTCNAPTCGGYTCKHVYECMV